jgi:hypothetical protein
MTEDQLKAIEARANGATAGPWHLAICCDEHGEDATRANIEGGAVDVAMEVLNDDAVFIAAARTDVPALVTEVRRLRTKLATIQTGILAALASEPDQKIE